MNPTAAAPVAGSRVLPDDAAGVLAAARARRQIADRAEADLLSLAVQWAVIHPAESIEASESFRMRSGGESPVGLAGPGAPLVAEFSVAEFAAAVGLGTEQGKYCLGQALELAHRLPRLWGQVQAGQVAAWKARRVAEATIGGGLSVEAAAFVDAHVAAVAGRVRPAQLDRLVEEAIGRFMPHRATERRRAAADGRHFTIDHDQVSFAGTSNVTGELDLADALDLDDAIRGIAGQYRNLGCEDSMDVRRSMAAGELARRQLGLDLTTTSETTTSEPGTSAGSKRRPVRKTVLHLHLTDTALHGGLTGGLRGAETVGRCENTRTPVTADTIRDWCGHPETHLVVKPVIDLADHVHVNACEVPDRIAERVGLRDHTCVFPWCTRPARALTPDAHRCDCDHVVPYRRERTGDTGRRPHQTCTCQLAPLCRRHHRLKTHSAWTYTVLEPGTYLWSSPTATSTSATTKAPSTSPAIGAPRHRSLEIDPAPHPAGTGGATGTP